MLSAILASTMLSINMIPTECVQVNYDEIYYDGLDVDNEPTFMYNGHLYIPHILIHHQKCPCQDNKNDPAYNQQTK